uniref:non-specific serine/threonine protein kinase n=1 Tax=Strigamia maritima TaxID=126957 RepID=T1J4A5_STRMM
MNLNPTVVSLNNNQQVLVHQGAEAKLYSSHFLGKSIVIKERFSKKYRHPKLDETLTKERTKAEAKYLVKCRKFGIYTPTVYLVDLDKCSIYMEYVFGCKTVREEIEDIQNKSDNIACKLQNLSNKIGTTIGKLHENNVIHGDLTTSNMLLLDEKLIIIDFGLTYTEASAEDKGVDLYVLERAILASHANCSQFFKDILFAYKLHYVGSDSVLVKLDDVRMRGRKRTMVG